MRLVLAGFMGENRARHPKLIDETTGARSLNQKPGRGDFRPWREPLTVATVPPGRKTIYRMGRDQTSDSQYWLSWTTEVHALKGYEAEDSTERTYYTGDGEPKFTDNLIGLAGAPYPSAFRTLGVPAPATALTVIVTAGIATTVEARYYTYTFVNDKGQESAPAVVSQLVNCQTDATLDISGIDIAPSGAYTITRVRIYRTQSGLQGETEFFFLRELPIGTTATTDDGRELGEVLPTDGWLPPPAGLHNLTAMWNGMLAGIDAEGAVRYCIAFKPYAWPTGFETLPPDAKAIALATYGQRLLVLTTANPLIVSGSNPDSLDEQPLPLGESCIASRGVVSFGHGVVWPCPDGLAYFGEQGTKMLTGGLMTRDDWQAIEPASIVGASYEGAYFCTFTQGGIKKGFLIDPINPTGLYFLATGYDALYFDQWQDALFVLENGNIRKWDAGTDLMNGTFRSKVWRTQETNFSAGRIVADNFPVTVTLIGDGAIKYTTSIADRKPFRLPAGYLARDWQIEIQSEYPVQQVLMASSMLELAGV